MTSLLTLLTEGGPSIGPPLPAPARIGPVGEWFLPAVIIGLSMALDATKSGDAAKRDRVAAALTYAGALGFISVFGWAATIQGWTGDTWSWRVTGSAIALTLHVAFVLVLLGHRHEKLKRQAAWVSSRAGVSAHTAGGSSGGGGGAAGAVGKINTKLHLWACAAACSYVLARGNSAVIPKTIGTALTTASGAIGQWVVHQLGG